jgi:integrase
MDAPPDPIASNSTPPPPRLLTQLRERIRLKHYSLRTEQSYVDWARRFILFHGKRHPVDMGAPEVEAFLTWLAVERKVAASTQNQARSASLFLYQEVLQCKLPWLDQMVTARAARRLPVVLTAAEVRALLLALDGNMHLVASLLLYGTGMRLLEGLRLRVKDVEFSRREITVLVSHSRCRTSRSASPASARTGFAAVLTGSTDMSQT